MHRLVNNMRRWLGGHCKSATCAARRRPSAQLSYEQLESRVVPAVTYHGGPLLNHPQIYNVFLGNWTRSQASNYYQFSRTIINSAYMTQLDEYSRGRGTFKGSVLGGGSGFDSRLPNGSLGLTDILFSDMQNGTIRSPAGQMLYLVWLRIDNRLVAPGDCGFHTWFTAPSGARAYYAVMANGQAPGCARATATATHEIAEAVTDPDAGGGWYQNDISHEIGDLCNRQVRNYLGYQVQAEWSNRQNGCVFPPGASAPTSSGSTVTSLDDVESIDLAGRQFQDPGLRDRLDPTDSNISLPDQLAALPRSNQDPVTPSRIASTEESAIDGLYAHRSDQVDDTAYDLLFSNFRTDQRDAELAGDLRTEA